MQGEAGPPGDALGVAAGRLEKGDAVAHGEPLDTRAERRDDTHSLLAGDRRQRPQAPGCSR